MKTFIFFLGIVLLAVIIYAGYYTTSHTYFVIWFGLVTAILTPLAIEASFYPFRSDEKDKKVIRALSTVPEIQKLIAEAENKTSKVNALKKQQEELENLIAFESRRRTLLVEREIYFFQGKTALEGIIKVDRQLQDMGEEAMAFPEELRALSELMKQEDTEDVSFRLGDRQIILKKAHFQTFSAYGNLAFEFVRAVASLIRKIEKN